MISTSPSYGDMDAIVPTIFVFNSLSFKSFVASKCADICIVTPSDGL